MYTANIGSLMGLIEGGKLRPIAVTSKQRWPDLPDVPSLDELGIKNAESDTFQGIYVPAGRRSRSSTGWRRSSPRSGAPGAGEIRQGLPVVAEGPELFRARIAQVPMYRRSSTRPG
jgi:hypothetical protein